MATRPRMLRAVMARARIPEECSAFARRTIVHADAEVTRRRGNRSARRALRADALVEHQHLDPPILLPAGGRLVVDDRELEAIALGPDPLRGDAPNDQQFADGVGPLLGELDVEVLVAEVVRMALDQHVA